MVLQDQLTDQRAEEMNRNMMVLSVVAAIFLPLGFLTGLFGINVGGMPGVDNPVAFWLVAAGCGLIGLALLILFRMKKWL
jgi:zinc transporter